MLNKISRSYSQYFKNKSFQSIRLAFNSTARH